MRRVLPRELLEIVELGVDTNVYDIATDIFARLIQRVAIPGREELALRGKEHQTFVFPNCAVWVGAAFLWVLLPHVEHLDNLVLLVMIPVLRAHLDSDVIWFVVFPPKKLHAKLLVCPILGDSPELLTLLTLLRAEDADDPVRIFPPFDTLEVVRLQCDLLSFVLIGLEPPNLAITGEDEHFVGETADDE